MIYYLAEINPSIVFFVLWGILSWLSKNREKNAKLDLLELQKKYSQKTGIKSFKPKA